MPTGINKHAKAIDFMQIIIVSHSDFIFLNSILTKSPAKHVIPPPSSQTLLFLKKFYFIFYILFQKYFTRKFLFLLNNKMPELLLMAIYLQNKSQSK